MRTPMRFPIYISRKRVTYAPMCVLSVDQSSVGYMGSDIHRFLKTEFDKVSAIYVEWATGEADAGQSWTVCLYNATDGQEIAGSSVTVDTTEFPQFKRTGDIKENLPSEAKNYRPYLKAITGGTARLRSCFLAIYQEVPS